MAAATTSPSANWWPFEFLFQEVTVQPEQGKLVLFPPFWTHEHRGQVLEQGVKYIATTWVVFA